MSTIVSTANPSRLPARTCCTAKRPVVASDAARVPTKTATGCGGAKQPVGTITRGLEATIGLTMGGGVAAAGNGCPSGPVATVDEGTLGGTVVGSVGGAARTVPPHAVATTAAMKTQRTCFTVPRY